MLKVGTGMKRYVFKILNIEGGSYVNTIGRFG